MKRKKAHTENQAIGLAGALVREGTRQGKGREGEPLHELKEAPRNTTSQDETKVGAIQRREGKAREKSKKE